MSVDQFAVHQSTDLKDIEHDVLAVFTANIRWYARAASQQRALFYTMGLAIVACQVGTLTSFALGAHLAQTVSPILAAATSLLLAVFAFLSPGAKWKDFRSAEHDMHAQHFHLRLALTSAPDADAKRAVLEGFVDSGMYVVRKTADSHWRLVSASAEQVKGTHTDSGNHGPH